MHRLHNDLELRLHILVISPAALFVDHTVHAVRYKVPVVSYVHHYVIDLLWGPPERGEGWKGEGGGVSQRTFEGAKGGGTSHISYSIHCTTVPQQLLLNSIKIELLFVPL